MKISDIDPNDIHVGMKFLTTRGKVVMIERMPDDWRHDGKDEIINDCINMTDDGWTFFSLEGDDWNGHGFYLHQADLTLLDNSYENVI